MNVSDGTRSEQDGVEESLLVPGRHDGHDSFSNTDRSVFKEIIQCRQQPF